MTRKKRTGEDYAELLTKIKTDFDERPTRMAAEPRRWIEFIEHVATFGARYSLGDAVAVCVQSTPPARCDRHRRGGDERAVRSVPV